MSKSFHFDVGNSSEGHIGLCARVTANDEAAATEALQKFLLELSNQIELHPMLRGTARDFGIEYCNVYTNAAAFSADDIDDVHEADES
jgi:hypothetical protein